jgi:tetratricopeptide (TPR) repeat protein
LALALKYHEHALEIFISIGARSQQGMQHMHIANTYLYLHEKEEAVRSYYKAINIARDTLDIQQERDAFANLFSLLLSLNRSDKAAQLSMEMTRASMQRSAATECTCNKTMWPSCERLGDCPSVGRMMIAMHKDPNGAIFQMNQQLCEIFKGFLGLVVLGLV